MLDEMEVFYTFLFILFFSVSFIANIKKNFPNYKNKKNKEKKGKKIYVIDATSEMNNIITYLTRNYESICYYKELYQIEKDDRLPMLQWMWEHWNIRVKNKTLKSKFIKYDFDIIQRIYAIETGRIYMYYHQQEFINSYKVSKKNILFE